jgi:hypothetical protein
VAQQCFIIGDGFENVIDVFYWARRCHVQLTGSLRNSGNTAESKLVSLLLRYLADYEERLAKVLVTFEELANLDTQNTWCSEYIDKQSPLQNEVCGMPLAGL